MATRKVAAINLGKARVGLAVTDELGLMAHTRPALDGRNKKALLASLAELAREEGITRFLVGLPLEMTGVEGPAARRARELAAALADAAGVPVELVDERLTTVEASRRLRDGGVREPGAEGPHRRGGGRRHARDLARRRGAEALPRARVPPQRRRIVRHAVAMISFMSTISGRQPSTSRAFAAEATSTGGSPGRRAPVW